MSEEELAEAIMLQLWERHGVYAAPVQNSPIHGVNVWADSADRYPADTAWVSEGKVSWGPKWEHELPADTDPAEIADRIEATLKSREV